jgi:hypothetical protein
VSCYQAREGVDALRNSSERKLSCAFSSALSVTFLISASSSMAWVTTALTKQARALPRQLPTSRAHEGVCVLLSTHVSSSKGWAVLPGKGGGQSTHAARLVRWR